MHHASEANESEPSQSLELGDSAYNYYIGTNNLSDQTVIKAGQLMIPGIEIIAGAMLTTALQKSAESFLDDLYKNTTKRIKSILTQKDAQTRQATLYNKIELIRKVRTLWTTDEPVDLTTFYSPPSLTIKNNRVDANTLELTESNQRILVEGTVGQGKSTLLRYLAIREMYRGENLPLFIELRRIDFSRDFVQQLLDALEILGFESDHDLFIYLIKTNRLVLFLDAADEIKADQQQMAAHAIESLLHRHDNLRAVVTSRPDGVLAHSSLFTKYKMAYLNQDEIPSFLRRLHNCREDGELLINALNSSSKDISDILNTPLNLTLLSLHFQVTREVPAKLLEFYDSLFDVLLRRHDSMKPGYTRDRRCKLPLSEMRSIFDAFCFVAASTEAVSFSRESAEKFAKRAGEIQNIEYELDTGNFITDIEKVTNLIVEDGLLLNFPHKSVQEFHAASFIRGISSEDVTSVLYEHIISDLPVWRNILPFLQAIDRYRYFSYITLPATKKLFPGALTNPPDYNHYIDTVASGLALQSKTRRSTSPTYSYSPDATVFSLAVSDVYSNLDIYEAAVDSLVYHPESAPYLRRLPSETQPPTRLVDFLKTVPEELNQLCRHSIKTALEYNFSRLRTEFDWFNAQSSRRRMLDLIQWKP